MRTPDSPHSPSDELDDDDPDEPLEDRGETRDDALAWLLWESDNDPEGPVTVDHWPGGL